MYLKNWLIIEKTYFFLCSISSEVRFPQWIFGCRYVLSKMYESFLVLFRDISHSEMGISVSTLLVTHSFWRYKSSVSRRRLWGNHRARGAHFQPLEMVLVIFWFYNLTPRGSCHQCLRPLLILVSDVSSVTSSVFMKNKRGGRWEKPKKA